MNTITQMPCPCRLDERGTYLHICETHEAEFKREREREMTDEAAQEMRRTSREQHEYDEWRQDDDRARARDINAERGFR